MNTPTWNDGLERINYIRYNPNDDTWEDVSMNEPDEMPDESDDEWQDEEHDVQKEEMEIIRQRTLNQNEE